MQTIQLVGTWLNKNSNMNKNWEYKGIYHNYDMNGIIELPHNSLLKVCDLTIEMPEFMKQADTIFIDPPCSTGNLKSFYTKSDMVLNSSYVDFYNQLFNRIDEINPKHFFIEVFKSNYDIFLNNCNDRYKHVNIYQSFYYNKPNNKCWIFHCTNDSNIVYDELNNIDEEKIIKWICANHDYNCIGDLCMGKGLVGKYAYQNKKQFVGTELNKKRLAILVDYITKCEKSVKKHIKILINIF